MKKTFFKYISVGLFFAGAYVLADSATGRAVCNRVDNGYCFHQSRVGELKTEGLRSLLRTMENPDDPVMSLALDDHRNEVQKLLDNRMFAFGSRLKDATKSGFSSDVAIKPALVKHVQTSHEALLSKLMMVRQAKFTVDLTYYIFRTDETGYALLNELKEAIRRGVSVRVMVDSLGSINPKAITHPELKTLVDFAKDNAGYMKDKFGRVTAEKARMEVVVFRSVNPLQLAWNLARKTGRTLFNQLQKQFSFLPKEDLETVYVNPNRRSHDKILIADQNFPELAIAIIGGRNIANDYYRLPTPDVSTFEDLEVIVKNHPGSLKTQKGAITTDIADLFEVLYFHSGNRSIGENLVTPLMNFKKHYAKMESYSIVIDKATQEDQKRLGEDFSSANFGVKYLNEGFAPAQVDLLFTFDNVLRSRLDVNATLKPEDVKQGARTYNQNQIGSQIEAYMAREDKHIFIVSPYLWLSPEQILKFKVWLSRNPERKLTIITNSMVTTDNLLAQTLVDATIGPQLVLDLSYTLPNGKRGSYNADQIEVYEYGRLDAVELGGHGHYGKMHAKGVYLENQKAAFVTTYNADPRSQYLNSELGLVIFSEQHSANVKAQMEAWIKNSHRWNSEEYHAIRRHEKLGKTKREASANVMKMYEAMVKLGLVWLI